MLALTKRTEYALIAACHFARAPERVFSAREVAEDNGVRLPLLMNVLKAMAQRGLLESVRGARGGYRLACEARSITLGDLVEAVEGPAGLVRCLGPESGPECELLSTCRVRLPLMRVHEQFARFLRTVSVADVAFDQDFGGSRPADGALKVLAL